MLIQSSNINFSAAVNNSASIPIPVNNWLQTNKGHPMPIHKLENYDDKQDPYESLIKEDKINKIGFNFDLERQFRQIWHFFRSLLNKRIIIIILVLLCWLGLSESLQKLKAKAQESYLSNRKNFISFEDKINETLFYYLMTQQQCPAGVTFNASIRDDLRFVESFLDAFWVFNYLSLLLLLLIQAARFFLRFRLE
jgi:hypothetical protein